MRKLHLIRHAPIVVDLTRSSSEWAMAPGVEASVLALLDGIDHARLRRIVSSHQPKARETARILATNLGLPLETRDGLEEHHRLKEDYIAGDAEFREALTQFHARPDVLIFGQESATAALERFHGAIQGIMNETGGDELMVTHGTVITLLLERGEQSDPMAFWYQLKNPDHIPLHWPSLDRIGG